MPPRLRRAAACLLLAAAVAALAFVLPGGRSPARQDVPAEQPSPQKTGEGNVVKQGFPAARFDAKAPEKSDTYWQIEWELTHPNNRPYMPPGSVVRIKSARFMFKDRNGKPQWINVVRNLEIAEIYVPYNDGSTAFLDIHDMAFHTTPARKEFLGPNCVAPGELVPSSNPAWHHTLHKEVHDDGVRWMSAETSYRNEISDRVRRGEKLLLWSTYYGANYRYMIEYGFTDDGQISCRIGPTGRNIFSRQKDLGDTHLHVGCWRFEMDLGDGGKVGGPADNDVLISRRVLDEEKDRFAQITRPFNRNGRGEACEGSARWEAKEFTTLRVASRSRKNAHGYPVAYDLISLRYGSIRDLLPQGGTYDSNMDFINHDFWVTRTESGNTDYINVPRYAKEKRSLVGQPTTVWVATPAIHVARSEDFGPENGTNPYTGTAITTWAGFVLKSRDLFDHTPLYKARPFAFGWPVE